MRPLAAALALAALFAPSAAPGAEVVDGIAAQVGSDIVLVSEVRRFAAPVEKRMRAAGAPESEVALMREEILDRMIERRLVDQAIRRAELQASEAEVDAAIEAIARENGITLEQLQASVEAQGLAYPAYREQIRGEIQRQKLINGVVSAKVRLEEAEVRALYDKRFADQPKGGEEVHVRQILVPFRDDSEEAALDTCVEAEVALQRVRGGEPFERVARETSAVNPAFGGDVGWVHVASVAAWMADAIRGLEPGETSRVVRTSFGCNLLQLVDRREFEAKSYEEARRELYAELFDERMAKEYAAFIEKLRSQTYIERKGLLADGLPAPDAALAPGAASVPRP